MVPSIHHLIVRPRPEIVKCESWLRYGWPPCSFAHTIVYMCSGTVRSTISTPSHLHTSAHWFVSFLNIASRRLRPLPQHHIILQTVRLCTLAQTQDTVEKTNDDRHEFAE
ncbi:hypothetical protein BGZ63DRAFT_203467 [Mariannaea sp. PMI_226]|nr:hypothetical protein BGZ63DRAFT_203467 [Mariannaea sp. PMI_226]